MTPRHEACLVLFSGGQDSTTCLYWALQNFDQVQALAFDYGQRHSIELEHARKITRLVHVPLTILSLDSLRQLGGSALTDDSIKVPEHTTERDVIPSTFVPGRNLLFLTLAGARAYLLGIRNLVLGVGQVDYSGYPDCRDTFLKSAERTLSLALDSPLSIHAPLLHLTKAEIFHLAADLGCLDVVLRDSHTCYNGDHTTLHPWGYGCGKCAACLLRAKGYQEAFPKNSDL